MIYDRLVKAAAPFGLQVLGGFCESETTTLLLGPNHDFWAVIRDSPEIQDDQPDPIDRWSSRIFFTLGNTLNAHPSLPFGSPPYAPFLSWALKTGRCWSSPLGMLVHDTMGLMVSFRGALTFDQKIDLPRPPSQSPCVCCQPQHCKTACPVNALGPNGYDTDSCHAYLNTAAGKACLTKGCIARRACPISAKRPNAQSAHHMGYFHRSFFGA